MADCPQCHSSIEIPEQNFGTLFTCPACQAVYFVGWDGIPEPPQGGVEKNSPQENYFQKEIDSNEGNSDSLIAAPAWDQPLDLATEAIAPPPAVHVDATPDFKDIVDFGNSLQLEGPLTYSIFIKGIDIADTREKIKEALTDTHFAWDTEEVMGRIQNGALTLLDLSPAKAVVLINRIKYLPIEVSWNQNVLS